MKYALSFLLLSGCLFQDDIIATHDYQRLTDHNFAEYWTSNFEGSRIKGGWLDCNIQIKPDDSIEALDLQMKWCKDSVMTLAQIRDNPLKSEQPLGVQSLNSLTREPDMEILNPATGN